MELVLRGRRAFRLYRLRTQRYAVLVAHRRCGKTVACVQGADQPVHDPYPATWPLRLRSVKLPRVISRPYLVNSRTDDASTRASNERWETIRRLRRRP
jgi:hypothetical protein